MGDCSCEDTRLIPTLSRSHRPYDALDADQRLFSLGVHTLDQDTFLCLRMRMVEIGNRIINRPELH